MGLTVDIFRSTYRSRLNRFDGVDQVTIVNVDGPSEPCADAPAAMLVEGNLPGLLKVVAAEKIGHSSWVAFRPDSLCGPMFGGTFAYTSDGRWRHATKLCDAVAIHDRFESAAMARYLSE